MEKYVIILILTGLVSCNCKSHKDIKYYKPIENSIKVDYSESDNKIYLKYVESREKLNDYFYKMYDDDSMIGNYIEENKKMFIILKDTTSDSNSKTQFFLGSWLKEKLLNITNETIFVSQKKQGCWGHTHMYVEIQNNTSSNYFEFQDDFSQPINTVQNMKKGLLSNVFDTITNYENTKIGNDTDTSINITYRHGFSSSVIKFDKSYVTVSKILKYSNSRFLQMNYLCSQIDSLFNKYNKNLQN